MLSSEIPPPDLPCPCLRSSSNIDDERNSENIQLHLEVDLFKPGLDDNNPLPNFSIRDYVSSKRATDNRTNWPFSQKSLQLCLKHGVVDVLPPFQSLHTVKNPSHRKCAVENRITADVDEHEHLPVNFENNKSCSHLGINLVPPIKIRLEPGVNLPRSSVDKPESSVPVSEKVERNIKNPVKNCKLIVKLNKIAPPGLKEHLAVNSSVASETMASKVCPVCKTFSSSSNTTLNAHIDQCLSEVSTTKWAKTSKVSKHRIKPRKTKLIVDICATALRCTLEDLDRRNGTKWSSNSSIPAQELEVCSKNKNIDFAGDLKGNNEEGTVYVDSSGTKFLSLSKFSDLPSNCNAKDNFGARKLVKSNKQSKFPSSKNPIILVKKHKISKYTHASLTCSSRLSRGPEDKYYQQRKLLPKERFKEDDMTQPLKTCNRIKSNELGMMKQQVGSKVAGLRKINLGDGKYIRDRIAKNLKVKDNVASQSDLHVKSPSDYSSAFSNENPPSLPFKRHRRKENKSHNPHDEWVRLPSIRKRAGLSSLDSQDYDDGKRKCLTSSKCNLRQSRNDGPTIHERHADPKNCTESDEFFHGDERMDRDSNPIFNADCAFNNSRMYHQHPLASAGNDLAISGQPSMGGLSSPGVQKFSRLRKKLSVMHATVTDLKEKLRRKHLNFKKPRQHYSSESDDEGVVTRSTITRQRNQVQKLYVNTAQMGKASGHPSTERTRVLTLAKEKGRFVNSNREMVIASKGSETSSQSSGSYCHGSVGKNFDSCIGGGASESTSNVLDDVKEVEIHHKFVCERISERANGESFTAFSRSLDEHYSADYPAFSADNVVENAYIPETHAAVELNTDEGQGNYFVDVDPIPIPGPPGSFLPSPGRMSSEEPQGNSSLTTCRIQSSEDKHELLDMDSLNSPISSASLGSESAAMRSVSLSALNLPEHSRGVQQKNLFNISEDRINSVVEISPEATQKFHEPRDNFKLPEISPHRFNNIQPCCCSSKEGVFESDYFNCQESQLLRRRIITSLPLPALGKHMGSDVYEKDYNWNLRPVTLPEEEPTTTTEKMIANSLVKCAPTLVSYNSEIKSPSCGDCSFPSPSTSNPVLRLMGKDLMVMNKDENLSPQTRPAQLSTMNCHPSLLSNVYNGESTIGFSNEHRFYNRTSYQGPPLFHHVKPSVLAHQLEVNQSHGSETTSAIGVLGLSSHPATATPSNKSFGGCFTSSLKHHEYADGYNLAAEFGPRIGIGTPITYDIEKTQTPGLQPIRNVDYSGRKHKDVIVMDDSPIRRTHGEVMMDARGGSTVGISAPIAIEHDTFFSTQIHDYPLCNGFRMDHAPNFQVSSFKGMNDSSVEWNHTLKGSSVMHRNSLTASSPSTGHLRSLQYRSPGFSL